MPNTIEVVYDEMKIHLLGGIVFSMKANNSILVENTKCRSTFAASCMKKGENLEYSLEHPGFRVHNSRYDNLKFHLNPKISSSMLKCHAGEIVKIKGKLELVKGRAGAAYLNQIKKCDQVYTYDNFFITKKIMLKTLKMQMETKTVHYPDGRSKYYFPNGVNIIQEEQGNTLIEFPNGGNINLHSTGQIITYRQDFINLSKHHISFHRGIIGFVAMNRFQWRKQEFMFGDDYQKLQKALEIDSKQN